MKTAKILYKNTVFEVRGESVGGDLSSATEPISATDRVRQIFKSPVRILIESIYEARPDDSRYILREPIYLNYEPSDYEKALIKVGAKRFRVNEELVVPPDVRTVRVDIEVAIGLDSAGRSLQRGELRALPAGEVFNSLEESIEWFRRRSASTGIVAAYFSKHHQLRALAQNSNNIVKTRHAEMNLIKYAFEAGVTPQDDDYVLVSLQSCRMCAAALVEWFGPADVKVYFLAVEPNLENVKTALYGREILI